VSEAERDGHFAPGYTSQKGSVGAWSNSAHESSQPSRRIALPKVTSFHEVGFGPRVHYAEAVSRCRQSAIGLVLSLSWVACGHPQVTAPTPTQALEANRATTVRIELPAEVAHWRGPLQDDLQQLESLLDAQLQRWPRIDTVTALRLVCTLRGPLAASYAELHRLSGDPQVPRTHRRQRIAVVPLPRLDRLLTQRSLPPRTLRETIRHELVHLLCLDRPALADAPLWFHEGLAEAWVGLRASAYPGPETHALGLAWLQGLRAHANSEANANFLAAARQLPAELRYQAWAALVTRLLAADSSQQPWRHPVAAASLADFIAEYEDLEPAPVPALLGRDADFFPAGKSVLLVSAPAESVAVELDHWSGEAAFEVSARTGRSGATMGELLLGHPGSPMCLRVRQNQDGAWIAAWEARGQAGKRSLRDRMPGAQANRWRDWRLHIEQLSPGITRVTAQSGSESYSCELPAAAAPSIDHPWSVRAQVTDGAFELASDLPLRPALR